MIKEFGLPNAAKTDNTPKKEDTNTEKVDDTQEATKIGETDKKGETPKTGKGTKGRRESPQTLEMTADQQEFSESKVIEARSEILPREYESRYVQPNGYARAYLFARRHDNLHLRLTGNMVIGITSAKFAAVVVLPETYDLNQIEQAIASLVRLFGTWIADLDSRRHQDSCGRHESCYQVFIVTSKSPEGSLMTDVRNILRAWLIPLIARVFEYRYDVQPVPTEVLIFTFYESRTAYPGDAVQSMAIWYIDDWTMPLIDVASADRTYCLSLHPWH